MRLLIVIFSLSCAAPRASAPKPVSGVLGEAQAYFSLTAGRVYSAGEGAPPGFYVQGTVENGMFIPDGDVCGDGALASDGAPGWLELADGVYYSAGTARTPVKPYVRGSLGPDGTFLPTSKKVVY